MKQVWLIAVLFGVMACSEAPQQQQQEAPVRPARIFQVASEGAATLQEFVGRIEAAQTVDVTFEVAGPLKQLPVLEGQTVPKGSLLAALDPTDFLLAVREAEVQLQLARQDYQRKRKLLAERGISQALVDDAKAQYDLRRVRLSQAREALADSKIHAPFTSYIARRFTDNHVNVQRGDKILRIHDLGELLVRVNVPEGILATATQERVLSTRVQFTFAPERLFDVEFREVSGEADAVAQTYQVTFAMQPPEGYNVFPGMTATVFLEMKAAGDVGSMRVPATALVGGSGEELFVWIFDPRSGGISKRSVQVGPASGSGVPVLDGLSDGELIVAAGASQLRSGMQVRMLGDLITDI